MDIYICVFVFLVFFVLNNGIKSKYFEAELAKKVEIWLGFFFFLARGQTSNELDFKVGFNFIRLYKLLERKYIIYFLKIK